MVQLCRSMIFGTLVAVLAAHGAAAQAIAESSAVPLASAGDDLAGLDLYLSVSVNGVSSELIAAFHQDPDGSLSIAPDQLHNVGIASVPGAMRPDGLVQIEKLPAAQFTYDELGQTIDFTATDVGRVARRVDANPKRSASAKGARVAQSAYGALLNYSLVTSVDNASERRPYAFQGASGSFEARAFGPYGVGTQSFVASTSDQMAYDSTRLESTWSYSDPESLVTYRGGDLITGGLTWTRPSRIGGVQVQRSFSLRSDLVTIPVPELGGSAAVPSTVDVYLNNARRYSGAVPAGPFEVVNLPISTGNGMARIVVRDAQGQEVTTESAFYASSKMLAPGLLDFSAEAGFARQSFGLYSNGYDPRPQASGSMRYGFTKRLTGEVHAEGGEDLINAGAGFVFTLGSIGVASLAGAASRADTRTGYLADASVEMDLIGLKMFGRMQRTFGDYEDIASLTAEPISMRDSDVAFLSGRSPRALDQLSVSVPLVFDPSFVNLGFTRIETVEGDEVRLASLGYSRRVYGEMTGSVSAFAELGDDSFGLYATLSMPIGSGLRASMSATVDEDGVGLGGEVSKSQGQEIGDYGWRVRHAGIDDPVTSGEASYRAPFALVSARVDRQDDQYRARGRAEGSVVAAGGDVFFANTIKDAFAIVEVGAPDVEVRYENRPMGKSGSNGKLLLPRLRFYENNRISIDPTNLPLDAVVNRTREEVIPADRSGVVVRFGVDADAQTALVTFRDPAGAVIEMGAIAQLGESGEPFIVGYDGQAQVEGLSARNRVGIDRLDGSKCAAEFNYTSAHGQQVNIPDAVCRPL